MMTWKKPAAIVSAVPTFAILAFASYVYVVRESEQARAREILEQTSHAVSNYKATFRRFPPAAIYDPDGIGQHSWRILVLPFLEANSIYAQYDFASAWNQGRNSRIVDMQIERDFVAEPGSMMTAKFGAYQVYCGQSESYETKVVMLLPAKPSFQAEGNHPVQSFQDDWKSEAATFDGNVVLLYMKPCGIHWLEPRDVRLSELQEKPQLLATVQASVIIRPDDQSQFQDQRETSAFLRNLFDTNH